MAKLFELSSEWQKWVDSRPELIKSMCSKWQPNILYRLKTTGQVVTLYSFSEDGTVTVDVTKIFNLPLLFERRVFGIDPNELEECDIPDFAKDAVQSWLQSE